MRARPRGYSLREISQGRSAGFTLLEVMLVVLLMALSAAGVMMAMPNTGDDKTLENYAYRFGAQVQFVQDQAVMSTNEYGIIADAQEYGFVVLRGNSWEPVTGRVTAKQQFDAPFSLYFDIADLELDEDDTGFEGLSFEVSDGLFEEDFIVPDDETSANKPPQIFVMASGEMTAFSVAFFSDNSEEAWWVYGDALGRISVERGALP